LAQARQKRKKRVTRAPGLAKVGQMNTTEKTAKNVIPPILIFSDGACSGNPGPGGWAAVVTFAHGEVHELGGSAPATTNNRMELMATIKALEFIQDHPGSVAFYTDSTYVIRGITQWIWGWKRNGWRNKEGNDVLNRDLWEWLARLVTERKGSDKVEWHYSRGHNGTPGNERCDQIAVDFSKGGSPRLFSGPLLQYSIAIYDVPEDSSLPEMRPQQEKKAAYSYLSLLAGAVYRHRDWSSCERRVKGQSGAKFKKAMSPDDEAKILIDWGLSPTTPIREG
jgi:ribonuclease HI